MGANVSKKSHPHEAKGSIPLKLTNTVTPVTESTTFLTTETKSEFPLPEENVEHLELSTARVVSAAVTPPADSEVHAGHSRETGKPRTPSLCAVYEKTFSLDESENESLSSGQESLSSANSAGESTQAQAEQGPELSQQCDSITRENPAFEKTLATTRSQSNSSTSTLDMQLEFDSKVRTCHIRYFQSSNDMLLALFQNLVREEQDIIFAKFEECSKCLKRAEVR
jgi:hypothetical protein